MNRSTQQTGSITFCSRTPSARRGVMLPIVAVSMLSLIFIAGLMIDVNWAMLAETESQSAADMAARTALLHFSNNYGDEDRILNARAKAHEVLNMNPFAGRGSRKISDRTIRFGILQDPSIHNPVFLPVNNIERISACQVIPPTAIGNSRVRLFIAPMFGVTEVSVQSSAVSAVRKIDLMLVLDASRSMAAKPAGGFPPGGTINLPPLPGSRWFALAETVDMFLEALMEINPNARVGLATFGGGKIGNPVSPLDHTLSRLEVPLKPVSDTEKINDTMEEYVTYPALGLGTAIYDGILDGVDELVEQPDALVTEKVIILLSDGAQSHRLASGPVEVAADMAASQNVAIHTISFGGNVEAMKTISDIANGEAFGAMSKSELKDAFGKLLGKFVPRLAD